MRTLLNHTQKTQNHKITAQVIKKYIVSKLTGLDQTALLCQYCLSVQVYTD